jgi:hypothetical protein
MPRMEDRQAGGPSEISFDVGYLLAEIQELKRIAQSQGLGTLAYILECAAIEAKWQADQQREEARGKPRHK